MENHNQIKLASGKTQSNQNYLYFNGKDMGAVLNATR